MSARSSLLCRCSRFAASGKFSAFTLPRAASGRLSEESGTPPLDSRETINYDVLVVGAGPAGLAAAIRLKQLCRSLSVCVVEKGAQVGAHILSGNVLDPRALTELLPDWQTTGAPVHVPVQRDRLLFLPSPTLSFRVPVSPSHRGNFVIRHPERRTKGPAVICGGIASFSATFPRSLSVAVGRAAANHDPSTGAELSTAAERVCEVEGMPDPTATRGGTHTGIDRLFRGRARPLGLGPNFQVVLPPPRGMRGMALRLLGAYTRESQLIRGARALYSSIQGRADDPTFLQALGLQTGFRVVHALLVVHVWLCLTRLRSVEAGRRRDAAEVGQTVYEVFNHDCEKRVVAAGVTLLVSKWMRELEKNFYGACIAYDNAVKPDAPRDALEQALWRNVVSDGRAREVQGEAAASARALARYVRLELASLTMTDSEAVLTGNIKFSDIN